MKQYSVDLRDRLLRALDAGLSPAEFTRLCGVSSATLERWCRRQRQTGSVAPQACPGQPRPIGREQEAALLAQVRSAPDAALREHCAWGAAEQGTVLSEATMSRALARLGWSLKKSRSMPASAMKPPARRGVPTTVDPSRLVFVDECGTHIALTRLRARAPRRPIGRVPRSHEPNLTLFAALTPQGMGPPLVVEGRTDHAVMMHGCRCLWEGSITMGVEPAHEA
jgi:transposase